MPNKRKTKYTTELLKPLVETSTTFSEVIRKLGVPVNNGNICYISMRIKQAKLDTSHFLGHAWARGQTAKSNKAIARVTRLISRPDNEVFIKNSPESSGTRLATRLRKRGRRYRCAECGLSSWKNKTICLHVDHINGIKDDNRLPNLRFLCPNCHQQTDTWGRGNYKNKERWCPNCGAKNLTGADQHKYCRKCQSEYQRKK